MIGRGTASRAITRNATISAAHFKVRYAGRIGGAFLQPRKPQPGRKPQYEAEDRRPLRVRAVNRATRRTENRQVQQIRPLVETECRQGVVDAVERPCQGGKAGNAETDD